MISDAIESNTPAPRPQEPKALSNALYMGTNNNFPTSLSKVPVARAAGRRGLKNGLDRTTELATKEGQRS